MIKELRLRQGVYHGMYGTNIHYEKVLQALHLAPNEFSMEEKWLCVLDMGHIVATMYLIVFVTLSNRGGATYFPLTGPVLHPSEHQIICLLLVKNNHWVKALISSDFPLPIVNPQWMYHFSASVVLKFLFLLEFLFLFVSVKFLHNLAL
ncbi:uncharacterized protein LOC130738548 [Lotus japonicus]|uniref:uncharacterized protein LOC130738548 n=1 Tax=Lotus japonicus TaxID=34305 RepID=UPI002590C82C|nr:uncharacterized protein LOC130738548 [Lotus japonicus]